VSVEDEEPGNFTVRFSPQAENDTIEIAWGWAERNGTDGLALHAEFALLVAEYEAGLKPAEWVPLSEKEAGEIIRNQ
jgi:hypothetical protein